jgi:ATP-dependent helicase HepA
MAAGILARVPTDLDALNEEFVTAACARLGFGVERQRGRRAHSLEFGNEALVDSLPGVPGGSSFRGTFDREEAVENETLDYFAAGHALVEGLLLHLADDPGGRVSALTLEGADTSDGLVALYKDGPVFEAVALDSEGGLRPEWAAALRERPLRVLRADPDAPETRRACARAGALAKRLPKGRTPVAVAAVIGADARTTRARTRAARS